MRIFQEENDFKRVIAYNSLDQSLIDRHHEWCRKRNTNEKAIYLVFFLTNPEEISRYCSNRLENKYCIVYELPAHRDSKWILNFCNVCYSDDFLKENRGGYKMKSWDVKTSLD